MTVYRLLLPAAEIPLRSRVSKRNGSHEYVLSDRLRAFTGGGAVQEILAEGSARFLVAIDGTAQAVGGDTELVWIADRESLLAFLEGED